MIDAGSPVATVPSFPRQIEEVSPSWLTEVLQREGVLERAMVTATRSERVGEEAGFLSLVGRVHLEYDRVEPGAPASVVVKLKPSVVEQVEAEEELHAFLREIRFYREVAPYAELRFPIIYATPIEPPHAALVMEDLGYARLGDQVAGMHTDQVVVAARAIARLHARYWDNDALKALSWMPYKDDFDLDFAQKWPRFASIRCGELGERASSLGETLCRRMPEVAEKIARRPRTIVHQDLRADNLAFVDTADGGEEVIIFDWQVAIRSVGAYDIARLVAGSELPEERKGHQLEILQAWHDELRSYGVVDYPWDDAVRDFRLGALAVLSIPVHFCGEPPTPGTRTEALFHAISSRLFASAVEVDAIAALDG